ncbi:MAG: CPBP family intramembrane metalloprotease [Treponema sp.]|nr:CPBP family intramembrane metalloprotease [Treponema sp.]MCL2230719.1 CPBP family intramembrane metalloprotease [Treponema sp.]MCL2236918.1 CPBP family intramembrane metalloprotease [Treponema sp.]
MKKALQFIILTCLVSWTIAGIAIFLGLPGPGSVKYVIFAACYMFLPAICAVVLQLINKEKPFRNLGISININRWFFIAGIVPIAAAFLSMGISLFFPGISFSASFEGLKSFIPEDQYETAMEQISRIPFFVFILLMIVQSLIAGYTVNAIAAFGEELGWRGYLLKALNGKRFLLVSLITGAVWGLWHFPLILLGHNYPQHPVIGVAMMVLFCILLSPVMTYIVIKSKSVITAAVFHGCLNAIAGINLFLLVGGNDLTKGMTGAAGLIALIIVNLAFFLFDRFVTKENVFTRVVGE